MPTEHTVAPAKCQIHCIAPKQRGRSCKDLVACQPSFGVATDLLPRFSLSQHHNRWTQAIYSAPEREIYTNRIHLSGSVLFCKGVEHRYCCLLLCAAAFKLVLRFTCAVFQLNAVR